MTGTRPCIYPGCRDRDGNTRTAADGYLCVDVRKDGRDHGCRPRLHRDFRHLILDWVRLRAQLPARMSTDDRKARGRGTKEYGHPAEWASDTADHIVAILNWTHDGLAEAITAEPPPHPGSSETVQVRAAWKFIDHHFTDLCNQEWVRDTVIEIRDLHTKIRAAIGYTKARTVLPTPCPRCEQLTLVRTIDVRRDQIDCGNCDHTISEDHYAFYTGLLLDTLTKPPVHTAGRAHVLR